jgi:hypothetical protein
VKFYIEDLDENLSRKSKFGYNRAKISGTLREELSILHIVGRDTCSAILHRLHCYDSISRLLMFIVLHFDSDICT